MRRFLEKKKKKKKERCVWRRLTAVGTVGEPELLGQECRGSLLGMSQMDEGTALNSAQLC